jgi:bacillithiol biosynthesis cysteine-adding enzyme BshC
LLRTHCIPYPELPGTTALFRDYLYDFQRVKGFYRYNPNDPAAVRQAAARARIPEERRRAVVAALRRINRIDGASPALDALERPETVAVVTGQQVSLFGGPCYALYKALTAVQLARHLSANGIPAVPVFWMATEDHDLAEADHCWVFGADHQPRRLGARVRGVAGGPVGSMELESVPLDELRSAIGEFPFGAGILEQAEAAYQPGRTMGEAFRTLLSGLLRGLDLIFLDPLDAEIRGAAAPLLVEALERSDELGEALLARGAELRAAGYHAQVLVEPSSSLLLRLEKGRRVALRRNNGAYFHATRRYEIAELAAAPAALSPNALLRPVLQDYLLPTAAYIGGPAEIAYLAQSEVLYAALLERMPVAVPRAGFTLLDRRGFALLERYGLTMADCLHSEGVLRERLAKRLLPADLEGLFNALEQAVSGAAAPLQEAVRRFDPTLGPALEKSVAKMRYQVEKNRGKAAREALRREQRVSGGAAYLAGLLYPERHLQERLYSFLPFLAQHGLSLIETLLDNTCRACPDHLLLTL